MKYRLLLLALATVPLQAQVGPANRRVEQLENARAAIVHNPVVNADLFALICPFYGPRPIVTQRTTVARAEVAPADARLPDGEALAAVAASFQPVSSLVLGERRMLNMGGGRTLPEGHTFSARIGSHSYPVTIRSIDERGYTLVLGETELRRDFAATRPTIPGITQPSP